MESSLNTSSCTIDKFCDHYEALLNTVVNISAHIQEVYDGSCHFHFLLIESPVGKQYKVAFISTLITDVTKWLTCILAYNISTLIRAQIRTPQKISSTRLCLTVYIINIDWTIILLIQKDT